VAAGGGRFYKEVMGEKATAGEGEEVSTGACGHGGREPSAGGHTRRGWGKSAHGAGVVVANADVRGHLLLQGPCPLKPVVPTDLLIFITCIAKF
jgi:hypothetical protein